MCKGIRRRSVILLLHGGRSLVDKSSLYIFSFSLSLSLSLSIYFLSLFVSFSLSSFSLSDFVIFYFLSFLQFSFFRSFTHPLFNSSFLFGFTLSLSFPCLLFFLLNIPISNLHIFSQSFQTIISSFLVKIWFPFFFLKYLHASNLSINSIFLFAFLCINHVSLKFCFSLYISLSLSLSLFLLSLKFIAVDWLRAICRGNVT
ncbi:unnamed protein product [Acanthosepion pharaonis]|uniref:Uncharacterized protein n=1 Tax=Acanthosepion pharaonis TaxID=158019 RepID=A0A812BV66_ACAPH|nr:unnamed protein product [Sepia pharaonis]